MTACTKDHVYQPYTPKGSDYHAIVNVDGKDVEKWIIASVNTNNGFGMTFTSYDALTGIYYDFGISHLPFKNGQCYLHNKKDSISGQSYYGELCCASEPDQVNRMCELYEPDSLNNYIQLQFDTLTKEVWGMFKATYLIAPNEFMHAQCDSFYCKYTRY